MSSAVFELTYGLVAGGALPPRFAFARVRLDALAVFATLAHGGVAVDAGPPHVTHALARLYLHSMLGAVLGVERPLVVAPFMPCGEPKQGWSSCENPRREENP